jgi:large subunit ribosomal protein L4
MKLPVMSVEGKELRSLDVDDSVFGIEPNQAVLHQAFVTQRNNQRAGTASTKTRGLVQGSTRKTRMQKYTGRARHGPIRAPIFVGGGIVFGPRPRSFALALNKKMRRLAIRSALSGKVADGELVVVDALNFPAPKTKEMLRILRNVGIERSALIVTGWSDRAVLASARNLQKTKVLPAAYLNVADMLNHHHVLMTEEAVKVAEGLWGTKKADGKAPAEASPSGRKAAKAEAASEPVAEAPKRARAKAAEPEAAVVAAEAPAAADEAPAAEKKPRARAAKPAAEKPAAAKAPAAARKPSTRASAAKPAAEKKPSARASAAKPAADKPKTAARKPKAAPKASGDAPKPRTRKPKASE